MRRSIPKVAVVLTLALLLCIGLQAQMVKVYTSAHRAEETGDTEQPLYFGGPGAGTAPLTISVDDSDRYQRVDKLMASPHCHSQSYGLAHADPSMGQTEPDMRQSQPEDDKSLATEARRILIEPLREGARSILIWNQERPTDENTSDGQGGPCKNMLTIDDRTSAEGSNLDYQLLLNVSNFVMHGARRISSNVSALGTLDNVAFRNPDESIVLVTANSSNTALPFNVSWSGRVFTFTQPAESVVTFTWVPKAMLINLEPSSPTVSILAGESSNMKVNIWPMQNGTPDVSLRCEGAPAMSNCEITPNLVTFLPSQHPTAELNVLTSAPTKVSSGTPAGTYQLTIIATPDTGPSSQVIVPLRIRAR